MIPLSVPNIAGNEWRYVKECLDTGWISSAGEYVSAFENAIAEFTGAKHAVACMNGTAALHLALSGAGVKPGDGVILPNITFVASANAVRYCGANPIFMDVCPNSWQMDLTLLEEFLTEHTRNDAGITRLKSDGTAVTAIVPVHVLGNLCDLDRLNALAEAHNLLVVEDACESLGSEYKGRHSGREGIASALSFNGNKIISTGGGGMVLTDDDTLGPWSRHMSTQAKTSPDEYIHDDVGYNYRLVNVLAAIGLAQTEQLGVFLENTRARDRYYRESLQHIDELSFQDVSADVNPNCWLFTMRTRQMRELLAFLNNKDIQTRPFWKPMSQLPMYQQFTYFSHTNESSSLYEEAISLPSSSDISEQQLEQVVHAIAEFYDTQASPVVYSPETQHQSPAASNWDVQLFELDFDIREEVAAQEVIRSRWITMGTETKRFEMEFAGMLGNDSRCIAVSSGTAALHVALLTLGVGPGDEVIIPALTFVAAANVVRMVGATPVPADSTSLDNWNVSADTIATRFTENTKAVMVVHYAGNPCDMHDIVQLCKDRNVGLIEDVAHAPGALYKGQTCGTFGDFGCFSFFTNKNLSVGEGGMLSSQNPELLQKAGYFRSQGMTSLTLDRHHGHRSKYDVALSGLNYRIDEIRSAIGRVQLTKLKDGNTRRKLVAGYYQEHLAAISNVVVPFQENSDAESVYHIFPVLIDAAVSRDNIMQNMREQRIQTSIHYQSFREFTAFADCSFPPTPIADAISSRVITLPLFSSMAMRQVDKVVSALQIAMSEQ